MKFKCTARFEYEVVVEAASAEEAEIAAFEALADDATGGVIRTDLFDNGSGAALRFPMLVAVDVDGRKKALCAEAVENHDGTCNGYQRSRYDDEPCDMCRDCPKNEFYESEDTEE